MEVALFDEPATEAAVLLTGESSGLSLEAHANKARNTDAK